MRGVYDAGSGQEPLERRIARLAAAQHGVFARIQASRIGVTRDVIRQRLRSGRWECAAQGVLRLAGNPASWRQSVMVACLGWGDGSAASDRAAAALFGLAGFEPGPIEVTVPRRRNRHAPGIVHRRALEPADVTTLDAIPVTTAARTLIDLASTVSHAVLEEAVDDALVRGLVTMPRLRWRLSRLARSGRPGITLMRSVFESRESISVPASVFETRLLRLLTEAGLPPPAVQHRVRSGGRLVAVVDFAWPDLQLAIEADGFRWHSGRARFEHDRARRNTLTLLGWRVIHVTWADLTKRPEAVLDSIRAALQ